MHSHHHYRHRTRRHRRPHGQRRGMWGGFRARFFAPGELRLALLSLLADSPKHGYELMKQLEARSGGLYRASAGSVYPTLQQLEGEGLARSEQKDGKRVYRLTPEGEQLAEQEGPAIRRIWRRAEEWGDWSYASVPEAWEIMRPAMELGKAALRVVGREDAETEHVDRVREILKKARRDIERVEARLDEDSD